MAAIHDLIGQISDPRLRDRISTEWANAAKEKKFGLVFEDHLPELLPLYNIKPQQGDLVSMRDRTLNDDVWRVLAIQGNKAFCVKPSDQAHPSDSGSYTNPEEFTLNDLLVVKEFGEPIFPSLTLIDHIENGPTDLPWHTLIEADNYHALQMIDYLYAGQVDCIYIDPPYNTGAKDWKYNNDYVDSNDGWRHSKWLAFIEKRLKLAKKLLKPDTGVLVVTIDEHEVHHLGMLLEQQFPEYIQQMVTIVINPKGVTQGRFSRVEEYALFCFGKDAYVRGVQDDLLTKDAPVTKKPRWKGLLRSGTDSRRRDRESMFYPVVIDPQSMRVIKAGDSLPLDEEPDLNLKIDGYPVAWPIRKDGSYGRWSVGKDTLNELISKGYTSLGKYDEKRKTHGISYLSQELLKQLKQGQIIIIGKDETRNTVEVEYLDTKTRAIKTVWHRTKHDAGAYGTDLLTSIIGSETKFSFPKSLYSTLDAISAVVRENPNALVLDFFAGSGTTLNALNLLNALDGGQRRGIIVTNNEVSAEDASQFQKDGIAPGTSAWESKGICQSITWPRSKFSIQGYRDDGTSLTGEYLTGKTAYKEKDRKFVQIGFVSLDQLSTSGKKKQLVNLIDGLPQSLVKEPCPFVVSEKHTSSILFDISMLDEYLEALEGQDHITDFYIVTEAKKAFDSVKIQVGELLGPIKIAEDIKRPMCDGFAANLAYFKLNFLDKNRVALGLSFKEIIPLLWLKSGAVGACPELSISDASPQIFAPEQNNFIVLLDETRLGRVHKLMRERDSISHVFIVTDADESYKTMAEQIRELHQDYHPQVEIVQLYRDYLQNFMINKQQDRAAGISALKGARK
ncbi:TPA: site-specific DNA-methyltransferase [Vibrio vulnificus]|nr:site-specific DNA-methyltransferase [Vibrio vulnificus]